MQRPSFQFYPADWQANKNLRRCTHAEKGIWVDVMCLMHDSEEYGVLRWPLEEIAQAVGCQVQSLQSLKTKGVLKGADTGESCEAYVYTPRSGRQDGTPVTLVEAQLGPIWYSSRMVRDEHLRHVRGDVSKFKPKGERVGAPADSPVGSPKPPNGESETPTPLGVESDGSSSSSSSSSSSKTIDTQREESSPAKPVEWKRWFKEKFGGAWPQSKYADPIDTAVANGMSVEVPIHVIEGTIGKARDPLSWGAKQIGNMYAAGVRTLDQALEYIAAHPEVMDGGRNRTRPEGTDQEAIGAGPGRARPPAARPTHQNGAGLTERRPHGGSNRGGTERPADPLSL